MGSPEIFPNTNPSSPADTAQTWRNTVTNRSILFSPKTQQVEVACLTVWKTLPKRKERRAFQNKTACVLGNRESKQQAFDGVTGEHPCKSAPCQAASCVNRATD